jgi:diacylglycerol kinase family enzyme
MRRSNQPRRRGWRSVDPPKRPVLFVNPRSGGGKAARAGVAEQARARGIETLVLEAGQDLASLVREAVASGADALGMAGGDGSLGIVAARAREHGLPFVCIPAGTRNHFALDLGIRRHDLIGALDAFSDGVERRVDVGEVNGRMFLNNVSLGIYGDAVQRPAYRDSKLRTMLETVDEVFTSTVEAPALGVLDDMGREHSDPAVVLVSNNPYAVNRPLVGHTRPALDSGRLGIIVLDAVGRGRGPSGRSWTSPSLEVVARAPVHAGIDGEAVASNPPLQFAIKPKALRIRICSRHPGVSPSGRLVSHDGA